MTEPGEFEVRVETAEGAAVASVTGDLDLATASRLEGALSEVAAARLVVDLTACTFLDSAGVRALAAAARERMEGERSLALVATDPGTLRVLEITGLDRVVAVHSSVADAL